MTRDGTRGLRVIDSHLHLWTLGGGGYGWLHEAPEPLRRDVTAAEAKAELDLAGISGAILVQADDTVADTEFMLQTAARHDWVVGVVGWIPLEDPAAAAAQLEQWGPTGQLRGVRHLVHDDPRDNFLELPAVRDSLRLLAAAGLPFDVPDAFPRHLRATADLARALPELTVVIDHLGKPPRADPEAYAAWERQLRYCARLPNTVAKLSGLRMRGAPYTAQSLEPVFHTALEAFGADRLMYGGDWPMSLPDGGYQPSWAVLAELIGTLSAPEQCQLLSGTALRSYAVTRRRRD